MIKIKTQKHTWHPHAIAVNNGKIGVVIGYTFYYRDGEDVIRVNHWIDSIILADWELPTTITVKPWAKMSALLCFENDPQSDDPRGDLPDSTYYYTKSVMKRFFEKAGQEWDENATCSCELQRLSEERQGVYGAPCRDIGFDLRVLDGFIPTREEIFEILREEDCCG